MFIFTFFVKLFLVYTKLCNIKYSYLIQVWFGWVLWHINHHRLFNARFSLYMNIKYIKFGLVGFYGISTIISYLMPNSLYTHILDIYDLVWLSFIAYQFVNISQQS